ncbi:hypothetical protein QJQ45_006497 [Haematococcus lacustris]|nr:hypothetical protein QJQ45_006497 [Haematococcus lacustris]
MHQECLAYKTDSYGGVIVDELQLPEDPVEFRCKLEGALKVGVGAFVLNEQQQVLMVMERNGPLKGKAVWKLPTGLCNEVLEETGIRARFDCMLAVRQAHGFALGHSDLFVVVAMRAEAGQLGSVVAQEEELEAAQWMSLEDYAQQPFLKGVALYDKIRERAGFSRQRQDLLMWGDDDAGATQEQVLQAGPKM